MMPEHPDPRSWRTIVGPRLVVVAVVFAIWSVAVFARLVDLQVYQRKSLEARQKDQVMKVLELPAQRGDLLDRNGKVLAYSVDEDTVCAVPSRIERPAEAAARLCGALDDCSDAQLAQLTERLSRSKSDFAWVRHHVTDRQARQVAALKIDGVYFTKEPRRYYPNRDLAAHVLGFVGADYKGLAGIEEMYDVPLRGRPSKVMVQVDGRKEKRQIFDRVGAPPVPGVTIELTIDQFLQHLAERELKAGVEENHAAGGSVVIMDPLSGEILAQANYPTFNPNSYNLFPVDARRNRAVQDSYEPGSTFKIVTASAALEEKVFGPNDVIDTGGGVIAIGSSRTVKDTHAYGPLSFTDVIVKSSNIGAIKIGRSLGAERLGKYVQRFGFGTRLSPDFRGESAGIVYHPAGWNESTLASVSMGYEIGVTPLQMAVAASTVANGGELVQPRVVRRSSPGALGLSYRARSSDGSPPRRPRRR